MYKIPGKSDSASEQSGLDHKASRSGEVRDETLA